MLVKIDPGNDTNVQEGELVSFASLPFADDGAREEHLEDLLAENASLLESASDEEETSTLLIIGRQVRTKTLRRMDLVALDGAGSLILIEVKRDAKDVKARKDHAEIQAVRYAASLAKLRTIDELVANVYGPYIQKFCKEELDAEGGDRTAEEWARRKLVAFMDDNDIDSSRLNHRQEIVLVGASFDDDTKSAAAWLAKYDLPIRVIELQPIKHEDQYFLNVRQLIPPLEYEDFYVDLVGGSDGQRAKKSSTSGNRKMRIRLDAILQAGKVSIGDEIIFKKEPDKKAQLLDGKRCEYEGKVNSILNWAKKISGWSSVNIYEWLRHVPTGRLLEDLRQELEEDLDKKEAESEIDAEGEAEAQGDAAGAADDQPQQEGSPQ